VSTEPTFTVSEFVALLNQTLEFAYPLPTITGELANFRVSKNRWVYFDLKDEEATVRFFGTVYQLPGPLEDGMLMSVQGSPRLHPQYGFSVTVVNMRPTGEGSIKKAAKLLETKLTAEGLFDPARKRMLPYPPRCIGLITSSESAAYRDFVKVLGARWGGLEIVLVDVQVQGEAAVQQIVQAVEYFNTHAVPPEVVVITRGGGSAEDLQVFSSEQLTRAVAASRIPTLVAIGHEVDVSLAELAADQRASTPSNAAELLVPDRATVLARFAEQQYRLGEMVRDVLDDADEHLGRLQQGLHTAARYHMDQTRQRLGMHRQLLQAFDPQAALQRGYALVRKGKQLVRHAAQLAPGDKLMVQFVDAQVAAEVRHLKDKE
jgi:exodeoxyribonuclease VII large subunit